MSGVRKEFYFRVNIVLEMPDDLNEGDTVLSLHENTSGQRCYVVEVSSRTPRAAAADYYAYLKLASGRLIDNYVCINGINEKQQLFVREYLIDCNASQAGDKGGL